MPRARLPLRLAALVAASLLASAATQAQTLTKHFELDNVWLLPDTSHPGYPAQPMSGAFDWIYAAGDFENGTGQFTQIYLPWVGLTLADLNFTFELNSIEITLNGNYHDIGVDVMMIFASDLSPTAPSLVDLGASHFELQRGVTYQGHFISGSAIPDNDLLLAVSGACPSLQFQVSGATPNANVALLYASAAGSFTVPISKPCAGIVLGLDGSVALGRMLRANAQGEAFFSANLPTGACGRSVLQLLDLPSCAISPVVSL